MRDAVRELIEAARCVCEHDLPRIDAVYPNHVRVLRRANRLREALAAVEAQGWQPIETAPRGSGEDGPQMMDHPDYVKPPRILIHGSEGTVTGNYSWYYHEGYGRGYECGIPAWRDTNDEPIYDATHWMPLPDPPEALDRARKGGE